MDWLSPTFLSISDHNTYNMIHFTNKNNTYQNPNPFSTVKSYRTPSIFRKRCLRSSATITFSFNSGGSNGDLSLQGGRSLSSLGRIAVSSVVVVSLGVGVFVAAASVAAASAPINFSYRQTVLQEQRLQGKNYRSNW